MLLELRFVDDISQTVLAPADSDLTEGILEDVLRYRRDTIFQRVDGRGIILVPGSSDHFIGLLKNSCPHRGLVLRPSAIEFFHTDVVNIGFELSRLTSCLQH